MVKPQSLQVVRWSTDAVPPAQRLDYCASALSSAIVPMHLDAQVPHTFQNDVGMADLGFISVMRMRGSAHRTYHSGTKHGRVYHLLINLNSPWLITHRERARLNPGDAILVDSMLPVDLTLSDFEHVHLKLSEAWVKQWLPSPSVLVGRRIPADSGWGRALTSFAVQLSPQFVVDSPLPLSVIVDQLGALLALIADQIGGTKPAARHPKTDLHQQIKDAIVQRCTDQALTAQQIAESLSISTRTLHRTLGAYSETFGASLMAARVEVAVRMLESPLFRRLTTAEIGRRCGFSSAPHFSRVVVNRTGRTPTQLRHGVQAGEEPEAHAGGRNPGSAGC